MLKYADELYPGNEEILCMLAEIYLLVGRKEDAMHSLEKVQNPSQLTIELRKKCEYE